MKRHLLPLLLLAAAAATAAADGFFDPPPPPPERVAELDALCARLEALGMPAVPPDAEWVRDPAAGAGYLFGRTWFLARFLTVPFFPNADKLDGNAWRWTPAPDEPARVLTVYGDDLRASRDYHPEWLDAARLPRALAGLRSALAGRAPGAATNLLGPVVLFSAQLHRHGETAHAAAFLDLLDAAGRRAEAEASASNFLGRVRFAKLAQSPLRKKDLPAFADALERNLALFPNAFAPAPPDLAVPSARDAPAHLAEVLRTIKRDGIFTGNIPDPRLEMLAEVRDRIAGRPIPGVPDDLQDLARALDSATGRDGSLATKGRELTWQRLLDIPWLLPEAWTNALPVPSNAVWRVRALGPRALDLLLPLLRDETAVDGDWFLDTHKHTYTRADAAKRLLWEILSGGIGAGFFAADPGDDRDNRLRAAVSDAEDLFLFYLHSPLDLRHGRDGLLLAWLAERAAAGPLPKVEAKLGEIVRTVPPPVTPPFGDTVPSPQRELFFALFYAAVRGEAGAAFRDRILADCRDFAASWEPSSRSIESPNAFGGDYPDPDLARRRARAWYAMWADAFAALPSGPADPAARTALAAEVADWLRATARANYDDVPVFRTCPVPPVPALVRGLLESFPR